MNHCVRATAGIRKSIYSSVLLAWPYHSTSLSNASSASNIESKCNRTVQTLFEITGVGTVPSLERGETAASIGTIRPSGSICSNVPIGSCVGLALSARRASAPEQADEPDEHLHSLHTKPHPGQNISSRIIFSFECSLVISPRSSDAKTAKPKPRHPSLPCT